MDYISIKNFSIRAGVTPQALYQRLDKDLQEYVKVINGKKMLDTRALELFDGKGIEQDISNALHGTLKVLEGQLIEKDRLIADQQQSIRELTAALEHTTGSLHAAQALHAGTMQKQLDDAAPKKSFWARFKKKEDGHE